MPEEQEPFVAEDGKAAEPTWSPTSAAWGTKSGSPWRPIATGLGREAMITYWERTDMTRPEEPFTIHGWWFVAAFFAGFWLARLG